MNKQLRVFTNNISSVLDSSTKSKSTCLNKQQHRVQCEIRKLNKDYPTDLRGAHLSVQNVPNVQKKQRRQQQQIKTNKNKQGNGNMSLVAYFFQSNIFSYVRSFIGANAFPISWDVNEQQKNKNTVNVFRNWNSLNKFGTNKLLGV